MAEPFTSKNWRVWVQPNGPNTDMEMVGCIDSADISESGGGIKDVIRCFRADGSGWDGLAMREEDVETTLAAEITAWPPGIVYRPLTALRQTIAEYSDINDIHFC